MKRICKGIFISLNILITLILSIVLSGCGSKSLTISSPSVTTQNGWTQFTDGNHIYNLLLNGNDLWAATAGGIVRWNTQSGTYQKYTSFDGLPGNDIPAIFRDSAGTLWCGGTQGIASYDGSKWSIHHDAPFKYQIDAITADNKRGLWFNSIDNSFIYYHGKSWTSFPYHENKLNTGWGPIEEDTGIPPVLIVDNKGNLWNIESYDISYYDGQNWHDVMSGGVGSPDIEGGIPTIPVNAAVMTKDGSLWFASSIGISRYNGKYFSRLIVPPNLFTTDAVNTPEGITALALNQDDNLICANGNSLISFDGGSFKTIGTNTLSDNPITSLVIDKQNNIWCGTAHGIFRFDGKSWKSYLTSDVIQYALNPQVNDHGMAEDASGNIWLGTDNGVCRYDGKTWRIFTTADGLADDKVTCIYPDKQGNVWFGTDGKGLSRFDGNKWQTFTTADGLSSNHIKTIIQDSRGDMWFGTGDQNISRYDGISWYKFSTGDSSPEGYVTGIYLDAHGTLWFSTWGNGVLSYDGKEWQNYDQSNGLTGHLNSITGDSHGNIWVTDGDLGIYRYDGVSWQAITFPKNNTYGVTMAADQSGNVWFTDSISVYYYNGTWHDVSPTDLPKRFQLIIVKADSEGNIWLGGGGLSRFDGKTWQYFNDANGLDSNIVTGVLVSRNGTIWVSGQNGISRYNPK